MKLKVFISAITIIITFLLHTTLRAQILEQDSLALVAFYNSTGGPNWTNNTGWLIGPVSSWYGVTVEGNMVVQLDIDHNNLQGTIPPQIGNLSNLKMLLIGYEDGLVGTLPEEIGNLQQLIGLGIGHCSLSGTIPNTIGSCPLLEFISLWENNLTGLIPPEIGNLDSIEYLSLHNNQLSGPIPPELGNCTNLIELWLNNNQLTGTIPFNLTNLVNLQTFDLGNNLLSGRLPEYLSEMFFHKSNISIRVSDNMFDGPIPHSWGELPIMIDGLDLSNNNFTSLPVVNNNWIITFFHIEGNSLTFEHIESHYHSYLEGLYYFFYYYPQSQMGEAIDTILTPGSNFNIYSGSGGEYTNYKWFKNGELILESPSVDTLFLTEISSSDTGVYTCSATNSLIYHLNLTRRPVHITLDTNVYAASNPFQNEYPVVYPNPSYKTINIEFPAPSGTTEIRILDLTGECLKTEYCKSENLTFHAIDISRLKSGVYILSVTTEKFKYTQKILKI